MRRREFVRHLPVVTTGLIAGASTLSLASCAGIPYVVPAVRPDALVLPTAALAESGVDAAAARWIAEAEAALDTYWESR